MNAAAFLGITQSDPISSKSRNRSPKDGESDFEQTIDRIQSADERSSRMEEAQTDEVRYQEPGRTRRKEPEPVRSEDSAMTEAVPAEPAPAEPERVETGPAVEGESRPASTDANSTVAPETTQGATTTAISESIQAQDAAAAKNPVPLWMNNGWPLPAPAPIAPGTDQGFAPLDLHGLTLVKGPVENSALTLNDFSAAGSPQSANPAATGIPAKDLAGSAHQASRDKQNAATNTGLPLNGAASKSDAPPIAAAESMKLPAGDLENQVLKQLQSRMPSADGTTRIPLVPASLGEIKAQLTRTGNRKIARLQASQGEVQGVLNKNFASLQSLFAKAGITLEQNPTTSESSTSNSQGNQGGMPFDSVLSGSIGGKHTAADNTTRSLNAPTRAEAMLGARYGIRNVHEHLLQQIRVRMEGVKNEARIRLHPPELGEIKIHMVMEDSRLAVRMEVSEQLTRAMLERDLQQLKNTLADAGIDVGRFDIGYGEERSRRQGTAANGGSTYPTAGEEITEETVGSALDAEPGTVRMNARSGEIDLLVY